MINLWWRNRASPHLNLPWIPRKSKCVISNWFSVVLQLFHNIRDKGRKEVGFGWTSHNSYPILSHSISSYTILSHSISSYTILSHSISSHPIPSFSIPFHLIPSFPIPSHPIPSFHFISAIPIPSHHIISNEVKFEHSCCLVKFPSNSIFFPFKSKSGTQVKQELPLMTAPSTRYFHSWYITTLHVPVVALTQISAYITQKKSVVRKSVQALRTVYAKYLRFVERNV